MSLLTDLQNALPGLAVGVDAQGVATFTRSLTSAEWMLALPFIDPVAYGIAARRAAAIAFLASSGLAGRAISSVNNNSDRDAWNKAVGLVLGLTDQNYIILGTPVPVANPNVKTG